MMILIGYKFYQSAEMQHIINRIQIINLGLDCARPDIGITI
jgi:hypothetical protein